ncbi:MAG: hypothetical protein CGU28_13760 [Candidatus Dactylopiibacterium carminicum]|nr:MAG: hypothetical protein CGU28_13760 [Candidatus Dactylopiibacterium carminicum]
MRTLLVMLLCMLGGQSALAWNGRGHALVAELAWQALTPEARADVEALLEGDLDARGEPSGRDRLTQIASWPDEIREHERANNPAAYRGWHSRANQVCSEALGKCPKGLCVDEIIVTQTQILADLQRSHRERNEALKWVVHLVGDLHMPLHSGEQGAAGSKPAQLSGKKQKSGSTLHTVWDDALLDAAVKGWKIPALDERPTQPPYSPAEPRRWMLESRDVSRDSVFAGLPGFACGQPTPDQFELDAAYQAASVPVIRQQILLAAQRLAGLLNASLR